jgi:selenocysteine lyase/cysteine desulfurase
MHMNNQTGYIPPVKEIVALGHSRGIEVFVDGAHAFAHFPFTRDQLGCDYYGTSLHKWLLAPIGAGFLYVRGEHIERTWPLQAAPARQAVCPREQASRVFPTPTGPRKMMSSRRSRKVRLKRSRTRS